MAQGALAAALALVPKAQPLAVALSGGGDSLSLLFQLRRAAPQRQIIALIVDHRLQKGSVDVARFAARQARKLGADPILLTWEHDGLTGNIPDQARRARYGLMGDACRARGIDFLFVGHNYDDQLETLYMRQLAGFGRPEEGLMRLSSYSPVWPQLRGVTLLRPLLDRARADLREDLAEQGLVFHSDPANSNPVYTRARIRREIAGKPDLRARLEAQFPARIPYFEPRSEYPASVRPGLGGGLLCDAEDIEALHKSGDFGRIIACAAGVEMSPPITAIARAAQRLSEGPCRLTLGGADLRRTGSGGVQITRETGRWLEQQKPLKARPQSLVYDGRFDLLCEKSAQGILPLWSCRDELRPAQKNALSPFGPAKRGLFAVKREDGAILVPHIGEGGALYRDLPFGRFMRRPWSHWGA